MTPDLVRRPAEISRRALFIGAAAPLLSLGQSRGRAPAVRKPRPHDIRILEVTHEFEDFKYRAPYQFGGRTVSDVTLLNVHCRVRTGGGAEAWGFGSMPLGNAWAFPGVPYDVSLGAMRTLADELRKLTADCDESGHPVDLARVLDPAYMSAAAALSRARNLPAIPELCTLVVGSPFDAALHDAYGKAFGLSSYATYSSKFMSRDLSHDLGAAFKGEYLDRFVPAKPRPSMPVFHSVGASDPLEAPDVKQRLEDGLPNTLEEWIQRDGLIRFKIKLNGGNMPADLDRVIRTDRIVRRALPARGVSDWKYLLDFNEGCPNVAYLLEFMRKVREATATGFD